MLTAEDQLAICDLHTRDNHAFARGRSDDRADCFTPEAVFTSSAGTFTGRGQLVAFARRTNNQLQKGRHWTNNLLPEEANAGAKGNGYLVLYRLSQGQQPAARSLITGNFFDTLAETAGGWRCSSRTMESDA